MHADPAADGPAPGTVDVAVRPAGPGVHVVAVVGDVDAAGVGAVRAGVDEAVGTGARTVVLDLTGVVLLASAGMTLLLEVDQDLRGRGCALLLVAGSVRSVRRPLAITGLDRVLTLHDDVPGALEAASDHG
ncbi:STAS domain-containing protein [Actinomycetospora sp. TBRC 11914]|uniref:STAS domain-containing protein n=1 Tax=Actinomycetospora sp. TBRC 11914 TaxID=2729387 RepID=UPI00145DFDBF|nr:STAS domain-containing protein [Actinomycetospora sp. TBRC 11914]NMO88183.1 STAS domain-containing protein [Actinomycetospora sp. TBRC 11914]